MTRRSALKLRVCCRVKLDVYYAAEMVFYTSSIIMLVFWEERRKDFSPMLLHHVVSVALIVWSRMAG